MKPHSYSANLTHSNDHVKSAINIPLGVIEMELDLNPNYSNRSHPMVLICKSGGRSALAAVPLKLSFRT